MQDSDPTITSDAGRRRRVVIAPEAGAPTSDSRSPAVRDRQAAGRVQILAGVSFLLWAGWTVLWIGLLLSWDPGDRERLIQPGHAITFDELDTWSGVASMVGLFLPLPVLAIARWVPLSRAKLAGLGIAFCLAESFIFNFCDALIPTPPELTRGVVGSAVWNIFFPLLLPTTSTRAMQAALAAACMTPLAIGLTVAIGLPAPQPWQIAFWSVPPFLVAGATWVPLRLIDRLEVRARRARRAARKMGSYELVERLGAGGMGEVWRARHMRLARPAAIKIVHTESLAGAEDDTRSTVRARFEREALVTAELTSPHTVSIYDFGATEDGQLYIVMELLSGEDLSALVRRHGPMPPERVVHVLKQVCHSLAEAHARDLVHRDIKPSNITLGCYGLDHDVAKVLDFGLVKKSAPVPGAEELTLTGAVSGTPAYIAPELATGEDTIDGRADLYALGCVAWFLLTGRYVFDRPSAIRMILAHVDEAPDPSQLSVKQPIPPALERLVLSCLAKVPADRPASAQHLALRLEAVEQALEARWTSTRAKAWWDGPGSADARAPQRP